MTERAMEAHVISFLKETEVATLCRKALLTVFCGSQGPILELCMEKGSTVTSVNYCDMLRNEMRPAISTKRRGRLLHENARRRTAHLTINTFQKMNWEVLEHPAHSPDLAPLDFHLFGPLKDALRGRQFTDDDDVKEAVNDWLRKQTNEIFQWKQEVYRLLG